MQEGTLKSFVYDLYQQTQLTNNTSFT